MNHPIETVSLTAPEFFLTLPWLEDVVSGQRVLVLSNRQQLIETLWGSKAARLDVNPYPAHGSDRYDVVVVDSPSLDELLTLAELATPQGIVLWHQGSAPGEAPVVTGFPFVSSADYWVGPAIVVRSHSGSEAPFRLEGASPPLGRIWIFSHQPMALDGVLAISPDEHPFWQFTERPLPDGSFGMGLLMRDNIRLAHGHQSLMKSIQRLEEKLAETEALLDAKHREAEEVWSERMHLRRELDAIYNSNAWKLVRRYSLFMEENPVGRRIKRLRGVR